LFQRTCQRTDAFVTLVTAASEDGRTPHLGTRPHDCHRGRKISCGDVSLPFRATECCLRAGARPCVPGLRRRGNWGRAGADGAAHRPYPGHGWHPCRNLPHSHRQCGFEITGRSIGRFDGGWEAWNKKLVSFKAILDVRQLSKSYSNGAGSLTVVKDISFSLAAGDTCAILGPSGSGKTTLLGLCAGLDQPSTGDVRLDGVHLGGLDEDGRARLRREVVGFVFQSFQLIPTLTALENVMVPLELRGGGQARDEAVGLLQRVGLGERLGHYPAQLSGGEQQRVALARAFINRPKILFADEPTGNLDGETGQMVIENLFALNADLGTTLVLVTHDAELAKRAQRIIRLRGGMVVEGA
jgi:putative ABC transport system ATP-binding protein